LSIQNSLFLGRHQHSSRFLRIEVTPPSRTDQIARVGPAPRHTLQRVCLHIAAHHRGFVCTGESEGETEREQERKRERERERGREGGVRHGVSGVGDSFTEENRYPLYVGTYVAL
jgi:hypothetical protein